MHAREGIDYCNNESKKTNGQVGESTSLVIQFKFIMWLAIDQWFLWLREVLDVYLILEGNLSLSQFGFDI